MLKHVEYLGLLLMFSCSSIEHKDRSIAQKNSSSSFEQITQERFFEVIKQMNQVFLKSRVDGIPIKRYGTLENKDSIGKHFIDPIDFVHVVRVDESGKFKGSDSLIPRCFFNKNMISN